MLFLILWLLLALVVLQPIMQRRLLAAKRVRAMRRLERERGSRVITIIHRQEALALLGIPLRDYLDIEDSEAVLRAIELTGPDVPIDLVLHTPGGVALAAEQIARALAAHPATVTVFVPHYAMSGGTLIALAADALVLAPSAVVGTVDPQINEFPASAVLAVLANKDANEIDDETFMLADIASKAREEIQSLVAELVRPRVECDRRANELASALTDGRYTHDFPITVARARGLGIACTTDLPEPVHELMALYPQPSARRPAVEYVPVPYRRSVPAGGHPVS